MANRFLNNIRINDAYTFPASDGNDGQVITTDGAGNLAFENVSPDAASVIYRDNFTGDGSTVTFDLQNSITDEDQTQIYIDGVYQEKSTYSISGTTITFTTAPISGHSVEVISISSINTGPTVLYQDNFTGNGNDTAFTLGQEIDNEIKTFIFLNGVYQFKNTYTVDGTTLTFDTAPANGVAIEVVSIASAVQSDSLEAGAVIIPVKNTHTASIAKGTPVYITGNVGASERLQIAPADASNSAKMPAAGLLLTTLAVNAEGYVITGGYLRNITTNTIDGTSTSSNDTVYVKAGGGLTMTKPTGSNLIQNIAKIARSASGSSGSLLVSSILRTNDVPNLTTGKIWVGSANNTIESGTLHLDESNNRLGINNTSPSYSLDVTGDANISSNVIIGGNLTVDGTQTILNTQTVEVEDNILQLNTTQGSPDTATATTSGISIYRGSGVTQASFIFDDADDTWDLTDNLAVAGNILIGNTVTNPASGFADQTGIGLKYSTTVPEMQISSDSTAFQLGRTSTGGHGEVMAIRYASNTIHSFKTNSFEVGTNATFAGNITLEETNTNSVQLFIDNFNTSDAGTETSTIRFRHYRSYVAGLNDAGEITVGKEEAWDASGDRNSYMSFGTRTGSSAVTEKMRIDSSGNVGIGGNNSSYKLISIGDYYPIAWQRSGGTIGTLYSDSTSVGIGVSNLNNAGIFFTSGQHIDFRVNGGTKMFLNSSGNLGIGVNNPSDYYSGADNLVVYQASGEAGITIATATDTTGALYFADGTSGNEQYRGGIAYTHSTDKLSLVSGGSTKMTIDGSGNVGIGVTSPNTKLNIRSDASDDGILLEKSDGTDIARLFHDGTSTNARFDMFSGGSATVQIKASGDTHFSGGSVGIGTTPETNTLLHLEKNSAANTVTELLRLDCGENSHAAGKGGAIVFRDINVYSDTAKIIAQRVSASSASTLQFQLRGSEKMRITSGNDIFFGTQSTTYPTANNFVHINTASSYSMVIGGHSGTHTAVLFRHNGTASVGSIIITSSSTSYNTSSDYRLKENVVEMTSALDRVSQLKPSRFNFISDTDTTVDGFLAHEVSDIVPEAITGTKDEVDSEGNPVYQGIDQSKLVPLLVGAIKELKAEIETLKNQINGIN